MESGEYYSEAVAALTAAGVFSDTECEDGAFCPGGSIDRKTMAVWVVRAVDGEDPPETHTTRFDDIDGEGFHTRFVERMADLQITLGCGDGSGFCPDRTVTRAQMAVFLTRAFTLPDGEDPEFTDIARTAWYRREVTALAASGVTRGCNPDGDRFCPTQNTTRAQMAAFLHRALTADIDRPEVRAPADGGTVTVPRGSSLTTEAGKTTLTAPPGTFTDTARVSLTATQAGIDEIPEGEQLAVSPVEVTVTDAEIVRPVTLRFEVDTTSITPTNAVPAWYSSELDQWLPLDIDTMTIGDGEVTITTTLADTTPIITTATDTTPTDTAAAFDVSALTASTAALTDTALITATTATGVSATPAGSLVPSFGIPKWVKKGVNIGLKIGLIIVTAPAKAFIKVAGIIVNFLTSEMVHNTMKKFFGVYADEPSCTGRMPSWVRTLHSSDRHSQLLTRRMHICG